MFNRDSLQVITDRISNDIITDLQVNLDLTEEQISIFRYAVINAIAASIGGLANSLYAKLQYVLKQIHITTAERESLIEIGKRMKLPIHEATYAKRSVTATGTNGAVIAAGKIYIYGSLEFKVLADATITLGTTTVLLECKTSGTHGNAAGGDKMTLKEPIGGVNSQATVLAGGADGVVEEETEAYRTRLLEANQKEASGGNPNDYIRWAKEVAGVSEALFHRFPLGVGSVRVGVLTPTGAPSPEKIIEVYNYIAAKIPAQVGMFDVIAQPTQVYNFTIKLNPNTVAVQSAAQNEIADLFSRYRNPDTSIPSWQITIPRTQIDESISLAVDEVDHLIVSPASGNIAPPVYTIPILGVITWQTL